MTNDKELVEVWQKQFEDWAYDYPGDELSKKYLEQAWIAAKRTHPSVVLPEGNSDGMVYAGEVNERLTAAGIKYTIGE